MIYPIEHLNKTKISSNYQESTRFPE